MDKVQIWQLIITMLPDEPRSTLNDDPGFWTNGELILCPSEIEAETVADFLQDVINEWGTGVITTGYFDPKEDGAEADECTGFWYVDLT